MYIYDAGLLQNFDFVINSVTNSRKYRDIKYSPEDTITLIFTSGTTSDPKAVSLTNKNIQSSVESVLEVIPLNKNKNENKNTDSEILLSYLPLSHVAGQCLDLFSQIYHEGEVHFARPDAMRGSLKKSLQTVRPTVFLGVPRVWEKMKEGIMGAAEKKYKGITGTLLKTVSTSAKTINYSYQQTVDNSNRSYISYFSSYINYPAYYLSSSMTDVVKKELGFDRCKYFVSGAAPISTEVLEYFMSINMPIHEIYGMSETSGVISISDPFSAIDKYCGKPVKNIEVKIDPKTEEILVKGDVVFKSYHNYDGDIEDMFDSEGYFKTGDCGNISDNNSDGKLKITGRIKELIITAGGENIPPVIIENRIKTEAGTDSQMMVVGDKQKFLTILVFNPIEEKELSEKTIEDAIKTYNNNYSISNSQKIQKFKIVRDALTVESGLLTPTMKMKRSIIAKHYGDVIKEMYSDS
jgi:long-chain-fatty-acid--CoA ligase ACSBG